MSLWIRPRRHRPTFLQDKPTELARSVPSILLRGGGAPAFFDDVRAAPDETLDALPRTAWPLDDTAPARIRGADALWIAHFSGQSLLDSAQRLASFASLYGAAYPARELALCERALLYLAAFAAPDAGESPFGDALSETRQAITLASNALDTATATLALETDTLSAAPLEN